MIIATNIATVHSAAAVTIIVAVAMVTAIIAEQSFSMIQLRRRHREFTPEGLRALRPFGYKVHRITAAANRREIADVAALPKVVRRDGAQGAHAPRE